MMYPIWGNDIDIEGRGYFSFVVDEIMHDIYDVRRINFKPGDIVLDIGAHIGLFSITLAKKYPFIHIVSFEPAPENYHFLMRNIHANNVKNITPIQCAVGNKNSLITLQYHPEKSYAASSAFKDRQEYWENIVVQCIDINHIIEDYAPKGCKMMKLDCEGAEWDIIPACQHLTNIEFLSLEWHISGQTSQEKQHFIRRIQQHWPKAFLNVRINEVTLEEIAA